MTTLSNVLNYVIPSQISFAFDKAPKLEKLRVTSILFQIAFRIEVTVEDYFGLRTIINII